VAVVQEKQQQDNWCWIACFRMACSFFGKSVPEQCLLAQQFLGIGNCCPAGSNSACNQRLPEANIPKLYQSALLQSTTIAIDDMMFQRTLGAGALLLLLVAFPATYHFILLSEHDAGSYTVNDPADATPFRATYDAISTAYQSGGNIASAWRIDGA
jgi:hypothetical protein